MKSKKQSEFDFSGLTLVEKIEIPVPAGKGRTSPLNKLPVLAKLITLFDYVRTTGIAPYEIASNEEGKSIVIDLEDPVIKKAMIGYKQPKESLRARLKVLMKQRQVTNLLSMSERGSKFYIFGRPEE